MIHARHSVTSGARFATVSTTPANDTASAEKARLTEARLRIAHWRRWGPKKDPLSRTSADERLAAGPAGRPSHTLSHRLVF